MEDSELCCEFTLEHAVESLLTCVVRQVRVVTMYKYMLIERSGDGARRTATRAGLQRRCLRLGSSRWVPGMCVKPLEPSRWHTEASYLVGGRGATFGIFTAVYKIALVSEKTWSYYVQL